MTRSPRRASRRSTSSASPRGALRSRSARLGTDRLRLRGTPGAALRPAARHRLAAATAVGADLARSALFAVWDGAGRARGLRGRGWFGRAGGAGAGPRRRGVRAAAGTAVRPRPVERPRRPRRPADRPWTRAGLRRPRPRRRPHPRHRPAVALAPLPRRPAAGVRGAGGGRPGCAPPSRIGEAPSGCRRRSACGPTPPPSPRSRRSPRHRDVVRRTRERELVRRGAVRPVRADRVARAPGTGATRCPAPERRYRAQRRRSESPSSVQFCRCRV